MESARRGLIPAVLLLAASVVAGCAGAPSRSVRPAPEPPPAPVSLSAAEPVPPPAVLGARPGPEGRPAAPPSPEPKWRLDRGPADPREVELAAPPEIPGPAAPETFPIPDRPEIGAVFDEFTGIQSRGLGQVFQRGERYLPMIRSILADEGLPEELAYLALVESSFHPHARSPANAVGLWQFIESTGRASGLRIDWWVDERLDPEASTRAAAVHLKELYARFGDWNLALAAYNAGPGGVARAQAAARAECFWEISEAGALRAETRRYVPKFYAAVQLSRDPEAHGLPSAGGAAPLAYETTRVDSPVDLRTAARLAGTTVEELRELNPALKRGCTPPGSRAYPLRVPVGTSRRLREGLAAIPLSERLTFRRYQVRPGDTLWEIARVHGSPPQAVVELNGLSDPRRLQPGQELVLPTAGGRTGPDVPRVAASGAGGPRGVGQTVLGKTHVVRPGETVWGIARLYRVSSEELIRWNGLGRAALVRPGDRLAVAPPPPAGVRTAQVPRVHVVQPGENLWAISRRYGVSLPQLLERNGLTSSAVLRPGDRLVVASAGDPS